MHLLTDGRREVAATILINRPVELVFEFYRNFQNFPKFLGDVMQISPIDEVTSRWTIRTPFHFDVHWQVVVEEVLPDASITYSTASIFGRIRWDVKFAPAGSGQLTRLTERLSFPGGRIAQRVLAAMGKPSGREVRANLFRLKEFLETGRVRTLDYAVAGKFDPVAKRKA